MVCPATVHTSYLPVLYWSYAQEAKTSCEWWFPSQLYRFELLIIRSIVVWYGWILEYIFGIPSSVSTVSKMNHLFMLLLLPGSQCRLAFCPTRLPGSPDARQAARPRHRHTMARLHVLNGGADKHRNAGKRTVQRKRLPTSASLE